MSVKPKILTWDVVERGMNEFIVTSVFERIFALCRDGKETEITLDT